MVSAASNEVVNPSARPSSNNTLVKHQRPVASQRSDDTDIAAVCALSSSSDHSYLAYPSPAPSALTSAPLTSPIPSAPPPPTTGDILLFDTLNLTALNVIQAHKAPIASLALNADGTLLATASEKGTVVRVFSVPDAKKVAQFRRGSATARIYSINFNLASNLLAVSSDSTTIHIYRLQRGAPPPDIPGSPDETASVSTADGVPPSGPGAVSATSSLKRRSYYIGKSFVGGVGGYLPRSVSEMWEPQRDFAHVKLRSGGRTVVAMNPYVSASPRTAWS